MSLISFNVSICKCINQDQLSLDIINLFQFTGINGSRCWKSYDVRLSAFARTTRLMPMSWGNLSLLSLNIYHLITIFIHVFLLNNHWNRQIDWKKKFFFVIVFLKKISSHFLEIVDIVFFIFHSYTTSKEFFPSKIKYLASVENY